MPAYLQVGRDGEITLPANILDKVKLKEGEWLKVTVEADGIIRLLPCPANEPLFENGGRAQKLTPYEPKAVNSGDRLISDLVIEDRE